MSTVYWQFKTSHSPSKEVIVSAIVDVFSVLCLSSEPH